MIDMNVFLASTGAARTTSGDGLLRMGYSRNKGIYRLNVRADGEWKGMIIRALWHPAKGEMLTTLVVDGKAKVPALITSGPGEGKLTFEGSDGTRTLTSADLRYRVAANSSEPDDLPEPNTPAWEAFIRAMREQTGGVTATEKQLILAVLRAVADNAEAQDAYNALAALWGGKALDTTAALLGRAVLGKLILGRK